MPPHTDLQAAREILGADVLGPEEIQRVFGATDAAETADPATVPFPAAELRRAKQEGEFLILRAAASGGEPLTLLWLIRRFPDAFESAYLRKVGYLLKDDWGIELEPLAATDTCRPAWALVRKALLEETRNLDYDEQADPLRRYAQRRQAVGKIRRRSAIEIAFDTIAFHRARGDRLLQDAWDWSRSQTVDGGYLNIGHFDTKGMQVLSFSRGVRHGHLGICPNRDPDV